MHAMNLKREGIPGTRLKRFGHAPTLGKMNGTLECLKIYTRTPIGKKRTAVLEALECFDCMDNIPWNEKSDEYDTTVLTDLVEIADFCGKENL